MILYPDNYTGTAKTSYTSTEWETLENADCVFLPAAGNRDGSLVYNVGYDGNYWSSTARDGDLAYFVYFNSGFVIPGFSRSRGNGFSVRLITECQ